ncbi:hypothetical protein C8F04DRAFT_1397080 [Mycena alexandri]|uniref:Uncharacterized protein n=1 Tax=Mycena alexandri TaxID=1745969 RepID=A0AAD6X0R8_9AGAR|nr:hypothetical protein C8F04DRAFT_1397080 [Mycena alexandri]
MDTCTYKCETLADCPVFPLSLGAIDVKGGKTKAVEWGSAIAMHNTVLNGLTEDITILSAADIFSWLHDKGGFPKEINAQARPEMVVHHQHSPQCTSPQTVNPPELPYSS